MSPSAILHNPEDVVPEVTALNDIYTNDVLLQQGSRWNELLEAFKTKYGRNADLVARCPGRVNIIGEHVDYSLYEVLPMAITADVVIAVSMTSPDANDATVRVSNFQADKFPPKTFTIMNNGDVDINDQKHEWSNYFMAGVKGALQLLQKKRSGQCKPVGMDVMVYGNVPVGGGLSSSAAFTCASALATLAANGEKYIDKAELVNIAIVSERYVGVNSGGMDQTASVFGRRGNALYVSFAPQLSATAFQFPTTDPPLTFVIAQTYITADKRTTAKFHYNLRVVETTLAAEVLARKFNIAPLPEDNGPLGSTLRGFHEKYLEKHGQDSGLPKKDFEAQLQVMLELAKEGLDKEEGYRLEEIAEIVGITSEKLVAKYMTRFPVEAERFQLRLRALHVFGEALRVFRFTKLLSSAPENASLSFLQNLGSIMNDSQTSCREQFDCSCPELDELCELAKGAGSVGSRLTGAGWGGCTVHLVPLDRLEAVKEAWRKGYYAKKMPHVLESEESFNEAVIVSKPGSGAVLYTGIEQ